MQVRLALFDPSEPASDGSFWTWSASGIDRRLLDHLYYDIAVKSRPAAPNRLGDRKVVGGIAQLTPLWACAWRFANAGRDKHGRPEHFVMLAAFVVRDRVDGIDLTPILTCDIVNRILAQAPAVQPIPPSADLEFDLHVRATAMKHREVATVLERGITLSGEEAIAEAGAICAHLPVGRQWACRILGESDTVNIALTCIDIETDPDAASRTPPVKSYDEERPLPIPCAASFTPEGKELECESGPSIHRARIARLAHGPGLLITALRGLPHFALPALVGLAARHKGWAGLIAAVVSALVAAVWWRCF